MDSWVWHQVSLELSDINVESTVESEGGSQGRDNLSNKSVQVGVRWSFNVEVAPANIVQSLVVKAKCTVSVLKKGMSRKNGVIRLNNSSGNLRRG